MLESGAGAASVAGDMYRKILVAADGSKTAARAVDRAAEVAQATGAVLTGLTAEAKVVTGAPSTQILAEATAGGYDLLVVGNKGTTGASRFPHTSVPNKVSHHAPIALLIDRTT